MTIQEALNGLDNGRFHQLQCNGVIVDKENPYSDNTYRRWTLTFCNNKNVEWTRQEIEKDLEGYDIQVY